jgi:hypothetical protein
VTQNRQTSKLYKFRVSHSLDFTAGAASPPKRDRGKSATKIKRDSYWLNHQWQEFLTVETDSGLIERMQSDLGRLDFETLCDLFDAYESQIETYFNLGETEKAATLERHSIILAERISGLVSADSDLPMGLSDATNCHTNGQQERIIENGQQNQGFQKRAKRGSKGITPYAKRSIRSCGVLLEENLGRKNLAFVTCTLPSLTESQNKQVCENWRPITRNFFQSLTRMLERKNLSTDYVQVTEIQEKRFTQWGQVCPHLHFVCQSRLHSREGWRISPADIQFLWQRALETCLDVSLDCRYATRIENPRKSLAAELGKYLSKGGKMIRQIVDRGLGELLPSSWHGASRSLKRLERSKRIERTGEVATYLLTHLEALRDANEIWFTRIYVKFTCPQTGIEQEHCVGVVGRFKSRAALNRVLNSQNSNNSCVA